MSFSQATITQVLPPAIENGIATFTWTSSSPPGTWYQLYVDLHLAWSGQVLTTTVAVPTGTSSFDIGTVAAGEQNTDFSSTFSGTNLFANLSWLGGSFESIDLVGFYVYMGTTVGSAVDFTKPVATITAYPQSIIADGFGNGGFGDGGFGAAAGLYEWTSAALGAGVWNFAVKAFDSAGNLSTAMTCSVPIFAPPIEPAPFPDNSRLRYVFNATTEEATLTWLASPSA
jgi:hypothetical protein